MDFNVISNQYRDFSQQCLKEFYDSFRDEPQKPLFDSIQYSLLAGGKRLRPVFAMEFCRLCGGDWKTAAPFACAVEMIHTYSLIHDDLPSMDNDDFRRGRPTNHKVYGEAMAILAGDALLTDAFTMAASANVSDQQKVQAVSILAECAGSRGMVGGQVLDIMSEERELTEQEVLDIQSRKTGCLIHAACTMGVVAAGGSPEQYHAACRFASAIGIAFQIRDDILDVIGTQEEMGKGVGTDEHKNTFVRLHGLKRSEFLVRKYTDIAISALEIFPENEYLVTLARSLTERRV